MKIALIQQHATPDREDNLKRGVRALERAAREGAELVAYAELGFLPFLPQVPAGPEAGKWAESIPGPTTEEFSRMARRYGMVVVLNLFEKHGDNTYDASPVIDADGTLLGVVRMVHIMEGLGFYEKGYYAPGDGQDCVFSSQKGRIGIAICYDRHFPEYMRRLAFQGAELVVIPQAGAVGEWTEGIFEAEVKVAAFQNGYYAALVNRVGREEHLHFSGCSFVVDPEGCLLEQASPGEEDTIVFADVDLGRITSCTAKRFFLEDRRPRLYSSWKVPD